MPLFAIHCTDKPGRPELRLDNRAAHLEYLKAAGEALFLAGPLLAADGAAMVGSLLVLDLPDEAAAHDWCAGDPYAKAGLFESVTVRRYKPVLGRAAPNA
jgi:uncharacterized protein YciI